MILALGIGILLPNLGRLAPVSGLLLRVEKTGRSLAAFSYTLYLTHYPLLVLSQFYWPERFTRLDFVSLAGFSGKTLTCLALAWLLYLPFEAQTSRSRRWLKETFLTLTTKKPLVPAPCSG